MPTKRNTRTDATGRQWKQKDKGRGNGEGSIYKVGNAYKVAVTFPDGKRRTRNAKTAEEARKLRDELIRERDSGILSDGTRTVGDLFWEWADLGYPSSVRRTKAPSTRKNYDDITSAYLSPDPDSEAKHDLGLSNKVLTKLTVSDCDNAWSRMADEWGLSHNTIRLTRLLLSAALTYAERRDYVGRNVAKLSVIPDTDGLTTKERRSLTEAEALRLLDAMPDDPFDAAWHAQLLLGLRPSEALGLRWDDVDLDGGVVVIRGTKTVGSVRRLGMPAPLADAFRRQEKRQEDERALAGELWKESGLVTTNGVGDPINLEIYRRAFGKLQDRAGVEDKITPNELRHSLASILSEHGVPAEQIADVLGHQGTRMVMEHYRHALQPQIDAHVPIVEKLFA